MMKRNSWRLAAFAAAVVIGNVACSDTPSEDPPPDGGGGPDGAPEAPRWRAEHVGPSTGFVSAVAFAPGSSQRVWISGDDSSGLYRSDDGGATLAALAAPPDWSAYAFGLQGRRVVAPNHFGRGVAISDDEGATWRVVTAGVPQGTGELRRIYDCLITAGGRILLATGSGLYASADAVSFAKVTTGLGTATSITRVIATPSGVLAGSGNGRLYASSDGVAWNELSTQDGGAVLDLASGAQGTYVVTAGGLLVRLPPAGAPQVLANPQTDPRFATALWTKIAVASSGSVDRIYLGVVGTATTRAASKLLVSDDGGATFTARGVGLDGASIFTLAVDPADSAHALAGTVGEGAFWTRDAGRSWSKVSGELRATAPLAFAQDPADPEHLVIASVEGLAGTPSLLERRDGAWSWQRSLLADTTALAFDGGQLVAAPMAAGEPMRTSASAAGPWAEQPSRAGKVLRLLTTRRGLYAAGVVLERRSGAAWTSALAMAMNDLSEPPAAQGDALVACGLGMFASSDGSFADAAPLPAPARPWLSCRFDARGRLLATGAGELWMAESLTAARTAAGWRQVTTPLDGVELLSVLPHGARWWLGGGHVDLGAVAGARSGLYYSEDSGATWVAADAELSPSRAVWQLHPGRDEHELFVAPWGGGLWRLRYR
jgi:hypothetical protein